MSFLNKIKNMFTDEEHSVVSESVEVSKLPDWLEEKANEGFERIKPQIEDLFNDFFDARGALLKTMSDLKNAELHNPNISEREKQIMEGNRTTYIMQHNQFCDQLDYPSDLTLAKTAAFKLEFENMIMKLAKSTGKGHAVLSHFFSDKTAEVNKHVKTMSDTVNKISVVLEDADVGIEELDKLRKVVIEFKNKTKLQADLRSELQTYKTKLANSNSYKDKIMKKMEELKLTDGYSEFKDSDARREEHWKSLKSAENEIHNLFGSISRAMKKYERVITNDADLFEKYCDNAALALKDDDNFKIMNILANMKSSIDNKSLEIKDPEKYSKKISDITKDKLSSLRFSFVESQKAIKQIDNSIRQSSVLQELNDMTYKVEHTDSQINMLEDKIELVRKQLSKIDLDVLQNYVVENTKEVLNIDLSIKSNKQENV